MQNRFILLILLSQTICFNPGNCLLVR